MQEYLEMSELQIQHFKSSESPIIVTKIKDGKDLAIEEISPNMNSDWRDVSLFWHVEIDFKTFGKTAHRNQWKFSWFANLLY